MRGAFVETLTSLASEDPSVLLMTGDLGFGVLDRYREEFGEQFGRAVHRHAFLLPGAKHMFQRRARARSGPLEEAAGEFAVAHAACDHDTHQGDRFGIEEMRVEGAGDAMKDGRAVASRFHCLAHDFIAGGGVKGGQVIGSSDKDGVEPAERPVKPHDLHATACHALGIDGSKEIMTPLERPMRLVREGGEPVKELFS